MIPSDFIYIRPDSLAEAVEAWRQMEADGKTALYYGGGSEIITMARAGDILPDAVIDVKRIPDCLFIEKDGEGLSLGAASTLNDVKETKRFPLLGLACGRIADHTNQCRITLGGNLCGTIIYRETSLPLLLSDARVTLFAPEGPREAAFADVFDGRMKLSPGELLVRVHIPEWALSARHAHVKKTTNEKIDYPLVNVTALFFEDRLRAAFSGVCAQPFRSIEIEDVLNDRAAGAASRAKKAAALLPQEALADVEGSGAYRRFVLEHTLLTLLEDWENGQI